MSPAAERRLLQACILLACLVPLLAGGTGAFVKSALMMKGVHAPLPQDLDSHFRYLSGLLLGIGLAFLWCVPAIERRGTVFRTLGLIAVLGGCARLLGAIEHGLPGPSHRFALVMELGVVPVLVLWQMRLARRYAKAPENPSPRLH